MATVLKINNHEINEQELIDEWRKVKQAMTNDSLAIVTSELDQITLRYSKENIINRVLLEEEAEAMIDDIDFKLIQEEFNKLEKHYQGWDKLQKKFSTQEKNISKFQVKSNIEKSLKVSRLLDIWSENVSLPNEGEMTSYYEKNLQEFTTPSQILFSKFFLPKKSPIQEKKNNQSVNFNQTLMENLFEYQFKQKNYADFLEHALKIPGIDYQENFYLISKKVNPQVEEILRSLKDNELSGIIKTEEGFYLFKRWEEIAPRQIEYDQARTLIKKTIFEEKKQKKIRFHLQKLRQQANIEDLFNPTDETSEESLDL